MSNNKANQKACIVGIGETQYKRWGHMVDRNEFQLACEAIQYAANDAAIPLQKIDGFSCFADTSIDASLLQLSLGMPALNLSASVWGGRGGGPCGALALAASAVETGQAKYVAVFRSLCQGQSRRYGKFYPQRTHSDMVGPYGLFSAAQGLALVAQRYRHVHGFTDEQLAKIPLLFRQNAQRNPRAVTYGRPLSLEDYLSSKKIVDPFKLFDCCLETDGACALIVTTQERARDLPNSQVQILTALQGGDPEWGTGAMGSHNMPDDTFLTGGQTQLAKRLFQKAQMNPSDISVTQIYDHFSAMVFITLEDFGFCQRGEAPSYFDAGHANWPEGDNPINTHGGSLSEAYVHGLNHVIEGVRQLRGQSTSQVEGAKSCLITGGSMISPSSAAILSV